MSIAGFEAPQTEIEFLRGRLKEEQINAERAKIASLEANLRCHHAERERDMYRRLALLWKERIRNSSHHSRLAELDEASFDTVANFMLLSRSSVGGIEDLLQTSQDQSATLAGSDDGDESYEGFNDAGETNRMDEDEDMEDYDEDDDSSDSVNIEHHRTSASHCDVGSFSSLNALTVERQVRTISITEVDM